MTVFAYYLEIWRDPDHRTGTYAKLHELRPRAPPAGLGLLGARESRALLRAFRGLKYFQRTLRIDTSLGPDRCSQ